MKLEALFLFEDPSRPFRQWFVEAWYSGDDACVLSVDERGTRLEPYTGDADGLAQCIEMREANYGLWKRLF